MSSKRHQRRRACQGKVRYREYAAASAVEAMNRLNLETGRPLVGFYHCRACGFVHVGHERMGRTRREDYRWNLNRWTR